MESHQRTAFGARCRELRMARNLKLRQVAEAIGISHSTYGNVESSKFRVVSMTKACSLADFFKLTGPDRVSFLTMWEETPLSKFSEERRAKWRVQNEGRNARRLVPRLQYALCCLAGMHVGMVEDETRICVCEIGGDPCEVCEALSVLGLDAYSTREHAINQLAALQGKLEAARAAAQSGATP